MTRLQNYEISFIFIALIIIHIETQYSLLHFITIIYKHYEIKNS